MTQRIRELSIAFVASIMCSSKTALTFVATPATGILRGPFFCFAPHSAPCTPDTAHETTSIAARASLKKSARSLILTPRKSWNRTVSVPASSFKLLSCRGLSVEYGGPRKRRHFSILFRFFVFVTAACMPVKVRITQRASRRSALIVMGRPPVTRAYDERLFLALSGLCNCASRFRCSVAPSNRT